PQFLARFAGVTPRCPVRFGGVAPDAQTARALLHGDYSLKLATTWSPLRRAVDGYLPFVDFCRAEGVEPPRELEILRWAIEPESARISYAEDGTKTVFWFRESRLRVVGGHYAGKVQVPAATLQRYAARLTEKYDALARWFPALHELREVQKVIGLAEEL